MRWHYFDLANIVEQKKIPTILSLHDYYSVCPILTKFQNGEDIAVNLQLNNVIHV